MIMHLYREPFTEPAQPRKTRLLFEADRYTGEPAQWRDFYLYVWVIDDTRLDSFQAVLDHEYVMNFYAPSRRVFGYVGTTPLLRGIGESARIERQETVVGAVRAMKNDTFPDLIGLIGRLAGGEQGAGFELSDAEKGRLDMLRRAAQAASATMNRKEQDDGHATENR